MQVLLASHILYNPMQQVSKFTGSQKFVEKVRSSLLACVMNIPHEVEEAIILVSSTDQPVFDQLTDDLYKFKDKEPKYPRSYKLSNGAYLIDGTEKFLKPEENENYIDLISILKSVKKCKFILTFTDWQSNEQGLKHVKPTIQRFFSIFTISKQSKLAQSFFNSIAILIVDRDMECQVKDYNERIVAGLLQEGFLTNSNDLLNIKKQLKMIEKNKRFILLRQGLNYKEDNKKQFFEQVNELEYCCIGDHLQLEELKGTQDYTFKIRLKINQDIQDIQRIKCDEEASFSEFFFEKISQMAEYQHKNQNRKERQKELEKQINEKYLQAKINLKYKPYSDLIKIQFEKQEYKCAILQEIKVAKTFIETAIAISKIVEYSPELNLQVIETILSSLYSNQFLSNQLIRYFYQTTIIVSQRFPKEKYAKKIFHTDKNSFVDCLKGSKVIQEFIKLICKKFDDIQKNIGKLSSSVVQKISQELQKLEILMIRANQLNKFTNRILKKMRKYNVWIYLFLSKSLKNNDKKLFYLQKFFDNISQCDLLDGKFVSDAYIILGDILYKYFKRSQLAIKCYQQGDELSTISKIITIYDNEFYMKCQRLVYLNENQWQIFINNFQDYTDSMIKYGYSKQVRDLCYKAISLCPEQNRKAIKDQLLKARAEIAEKKHLLFLEQSVLKQKQIMINKDLLDQVWIKIQEDQNKLKSCVHDEEY